MNDRRVLVVSACSARKLKTDTPVFARDLYLGAAHRLVVNAVAKLRTCPDTQVDLAIVSAGYGLLDEYDLVLPYDASFRGGRKAARETAQRLRIREQLTDRLSGHYSLALFVLGRVYLDALAPPFNCAREIYFSARKVWASPSVTHVRAGQVEAQALKVSARIVGAMLFDQFASDVKLLSRIIKQTPLDR